jgi:hypothetical protein
MSIDPVAGPGGEVLSLCAALRDGKDMLGLTAPEKAELLAHVARAEAAATVSPIDSVGVDREVRAIRYLLVEVADGPISAFMADAAAQIVGDGIGRLFS